jgi:hypothetical protein
VSFTIRRAFVAAAVTTVGAVGFAAPANADHSDLGCEPTVVTAALEAAQADVRSAQKSYTAHTKTSMQALVKQHKAEEKAEAKAADKKADRLAAQADRVKGKDGKEARAAAKAARELARAEAKEAARVERASVAELRAAVKAERKVLKAEWNVAKAALEELKVHADTCAEAPIEEPVVEEPVAEEPVVEEPTGDQIG